MGVLSTTVHDYRAARVEQRLSETISEERRQLGLVLDAYYGGEFPYGIDMKGIDNANNRIKNLEARRDSKRRSMVFLKYLL